MDKKHLVAASLLALSVCFAWMTACSSSNNSSCAIGRESCACTAGGACDPGLTCLMSRCVKSDGGSTSSTTTQSTTMTSTTSGGGSSTTTQSTTTTPTTTGGGSQGAGGAPSTTMGSGGAPGGGPGTGGNGGSTPPLPDGGPIGDLGKACAGATDCAGGLQCVKSTDSMWLNNAGPAKGYCSTPCQSHATCAPFGGICVDMSATTTPSPWCLQACTWGGTSSTDAVARAAKCHGRTDVACFQAPADDAGLPPAYCSPTCSQDSDCGTRKCDPASNMCVDTPTAGGALGTKCTPTNDTCAGGCIPLAKAQYCSQACVFGSINQCNHTAGALTTGGPHGLCALTQTGAQAGDLGFCSQECETVADCSDKTDPGGTCDTSIKAQVGHGYCAWP